MPRSDGRHSATGNSTKSKAVGRFCVLAVGLGIGAAAAPPTAAAQPGVPVDPVPVVPDLALPAPATPMDVAISVDGFTLLQEGTATADSGTGDIAIAFGSHSEAYAGAGSAGSGFFDSAFATGSGSEAFAGDGNFDSASANGLGSAASAGGTATDVSSFDSSSVVGAASTALSGAEPGFSGASGSDIATVYDPFGTTGDTAIAANGLSDLASVTGDNSEAFAGLAGSFDVGAVLGNDLISGGATGGNFLIDILPAL
ncbi:MAG: hypothetical protein WCC28_23665 [Mycobacterium sp.]|uniref:hypothetical protein n=1 Tax=Mycobacterium sp. TaxID=1785 RepID=UPI003C751F1A